MSPCVSTFSFSLACDNVYQDPLTDLLGPFRVFFYSTTMGLSIDFASTLVQVRFVMGKDASSRHLSNSGNVRMNWLPVLIEIFIFAYENNIQALGKTG